MKLSDLWGLAVNEAMVEMLMGRKAGELTYSDRLPHAGVCMTCNGYGMLFKFNGAWFCHRCLAEEEKSFKTKS